MDILKIELFVWGDKMVYLREAEVSNRYGASRKELTVVENIVDDKIWAEKMGWKVRYFKLTEVK